MEILATDPGSGQETCVLFLASAIGPAYLTFPELGSTILVLYVTPSIFHSRVLMSSCSHGPTRHSCKQIFFNGRSWSSLASASSTLSPGLRTRSSRRRRGHRRKPVLANKLPNIRTSG